MEDGAALLYNAPESIVRSYFSALDFSVQNRPI
jgi:hypothetical protein